jgi:hypothetical protein
VSGAFSSGARRLIVPSVIGGSTATLSIARGGAATRPCRGRCWPRRPDSTRLELCDACKHGVRSVIALDDASRARPGPIEVVSAGGRVGNA